jgi:hypothetical protein
MPINFLSKLLPFDPKTKRNGELEVALNGYKLILNAAAMVSPALRNGDLEKFDPIGGENSCQTRAVKIAMLFRTYREVIASFEKKIAFAQEKVLKTSLSLKPLMRSGISLQTLLEEQGLDVALSADELFLVMSFMLSYAKTVKEPKPSSPLLRNDASVPNMLKDFGGDVSSAFIANLVKKLRFLLSQASVSFVREQAKSLGSRFEKMCSEDFTVTYKNLLSLPTFWTYKTLLSAAQNMGIPLVFSARFLARDMEYNHCC